MVLAEAAYTYVKLVLIATMHCSLVNLRRGLSSKCPRRANACGRSRDRRGVAVGFLLAVLMIESINDHARLVSVSRILAGSRPTEGTVNTGTGGVRPRAPL
jgi:hypothetical protein